MRRILTVLLVPLVSASFVACPREVGEPPDEGVDGATAVCLQGEPFVDDGPVPVEGTATGDARRVSALRWEAHNGCERFVVDLADSDGNPAGSAGDVGAEVLRDLGVVRVTLRGVDTVQPDATDKTFTGPLAGAAYSVMDRGGDSIFVDVHLVAEAEAHVLVLEDPARVVVDLRPGGGPVPAPAPAKDNVVVLDPRPGEASYPLAVAGYARTFEANVELRIEQEGEDVHDDFTTATAWVDAWGFYEITVDDGPSGTVRLHVGEHSAEDGTWRGVVVELDMR